MRQSSDALRTLSRSLFLDRMWGEIALTGDGVEKSLKMEIAGVHLNLLEAGGVVLAQHFQGRVSSPAPGKAMPEAGDGSV